MADFIDFNAWKELTAQGEQDMLERQAKDVTTKSAEADRLLQQARAEAQRTQQQQTMGGGSTSVALSTTASYGDYLKAKQAAVNARALMMLGRDSEYGDARGQVDSEGGFSKSSDEAIARLQSREDKAGADVDASLGSYNRSSAYWAEQKRKQDEAAANRQKSDEEARQGYLTGLYSRWLHRDQSAPQDNQLYARQLSQGVDEGYKLPERTAGQMAASPSDRRGFGIEQDAWGTRAAPYGRPQTKKGTAY